MAEEDENSILLAEDNIINQKIVISFLRKGNYTIDIASNGQEVIDAVQRKTYGLVLMDIQMPVKDGIEATQEIRNKLCMRDLPIIALTANTFDEDIQQYLQAGMNDHLAKPINSTLLLSKVEKWLNA